MGFRRSASRHSLLLKELYLTGDRATLVARLALCSVSVFSVPMGSTAFLSTKSVREPALLMYSGFTHAFRSRANSDGVLPYLATSHQPLARHTTWSGTSHEA